MHQAVGAGLVRVDIVLRQALQLFRLQRDIALVVADIAVELQPRLDDRLLQVGDLGARRRVLVDPGQLVFDQLVLQRKGDLGVQALGRNGGQAIINRARQGNRRADIGQLGHAGLGRVPYGLRGVGLGDQVHLVADVAGQQVDRIEGLVIGLQRRRPFARFQRRLDLLRQGDAGVATGIDLGGRRRVDDRLAKEGGDFGFE